MNAPFSASVNGIVVGVVTSLDDPLGLHRVEVQLPHLGGKVAPWARLVTPMAGEGRGLVLRPEVGDEVLVAYEQGDPQRAYVLGALWSNVDRPPPGEPEPVSNHWRFLRSRSGHLIKLDDTPGAERIEIEDKDGKRRLVIDSGGEKIQLVSDSGPVTIEASNGDVTVSAPSGKVMVNAQEVLVQAADQAEIKAVTLKLSASADFTIEAGGLLSLKGSQITLN
ncbi:phage tail protein [Mesorhizobium sp. LSJC269B00]|uniref:phage baseplate assembly protein V n=1 Tax=Mesorhizobium sp. LSJC269B00 TaxID=1287326 RepID=UPI0003CE3E59|nr:phage baseplate assembly protein V [Mesorhizobium sp. LSJC269B00]ESW93128.1 phage tail protein [Mesorhizobium sp. LSJC269B00]